MAAEVTLKEESALEIGKSLANSFQGLKNVGADTANGGLELEEEKQQTSFLESISGGIKKMVVFFGGLAASIKEARRERLIAEGQSTELGKEAGDKDEGTGVLTKSFKEKIKKLTDGFKTTIMPVFGIFKGLLGKAALFGLLLAFALNLDKFSDDLKPIVSKIVNGFKAAFTSLKKDFFPLIENFIKLIGSAFDTVSNILKIFEGDFASFFKGLAGIGDVALRIVSIIGDAFFSLVDSVLKFFGIESDLVKKAKILFRMLPETIKNAIKNFVSFFTETIPNFFGSIKQNVKDYFKEVTEKAAEIQRKVFDFIMAPFRAIKNKIASFFGFGVDTATDSDPVETAKAVAMEKSIKEPLVSAEKPESVPEPDEPIAKVGKLKVNTMEELVNARDRILIEGPKSDGITDKNFYEYQLKKLNAAIIKEEGRGEDHAKANRMAPVDYALEDATGNIESFVQDKVGVVGNVETNDLPQGNTPMIEPNELMNNGGQLNKDSQEFASTSVMPPSMNVVTGGTTNTSSSNTTVTNIAESTTTSDMNAKKIFKTA